MSNRLTLELRPIRPCWEVLRFVLLVLALNGCTRATIGAVDPGSQPGLWQIPFYSNGSAPVTDGDHLFIGSGDGKFYAFDLDTGRLAWSFLADPDAQPGPDVVVSDRTDAMGIVDDLLEPLDRTGTRGEVRTPAAIAEKTVYITGGAFVYALDATTGTDLWNVVVDEPTARSPEFHDGKLYLIARGRTIAPSYYCLNANDGSRLWKYAPTSEDGGTPHRIAHTRLVDGVVYCVSWPRRDDEVRTIVTAVDADTGLEQWRFATESKGYHHRAPLLTEGLLIATDCVESEALNRDKVRLQAVDRRTGQLKWFFETSDLESVHKTTDPVVSGQTICFATDLAVFGLDANTGELVWKHSQEGTSMAVQRVLSHEDLIFVLRTVTRLMRSVDVVYALEACSGQVQWKRMIGGDARLSGIFDDTLYVQQLGGALHACDVRTGSIRWKFKTGLPLFGGKSIATHIVRHSDRLYFGTTAHWGLGEEPIPGRLYAIDASTGRR